VRQDAGSARLAVHGGAAHGSSLASLLGEIDGLGGDAEARKLEEELVARLAST